MANLEMTNKVTKKFFEILLILFLTIGSIGGFYYLADINPFKDLSDCDCQRQIAYCSENEEFLDFIDSISNYDSAGKFCNSKNASSGWIASENGITCVIYLPDNAIRYDSYKMSEFIKFMMIKNEKQDYRRKK